MPTLTPTQAMAAIYLGGFRGNDLILFTAFAMAESSLNTDAMGPNLECGHGAQGLLQINTCVHKCANVNNPVANARCAKSVKGSQGLKAWAVYTDGSYKSHLAAAQKAKTDLSNKIKSCEIQGRLHTGDFAIKTQEDCARDILKAAGIDPGDAGGNFGTNPGDIADAVGVPDVAGAITGAFKAIVEFLNRIGTWISKSENWVRVMKIGGGVVVVIVGAGMVVKDPALSALPVGKVAKLGKGMKGNG